MPFNDFKIKVISIGILGNIAPEMYFPHYTKSRNVTKRPTAIRI